ncbi:hypothetical protein [Halorussus sp. AFM4]|uniref:hypothetical protein n=1 Tax=Halorussus sp. AFM4 TaxID=3421651 RepID=UPI003EBE30EE
MTKPNTPTWYAVAGLLAVNLLAVAYVRATAGSSFTGVGPWAAFTAFEVLAYVAWRSVRRWSDARRQPQYRTLTDEPRTTACPNFRGD